MHGTVATGHRGALRLTTAVVLCLLALGHGAEVAHHAVTGHTVCPEHGELLHGEARQAAAEHRTPEAGVRFATRPAADPRQDVHDRSVCVLSLHPSDQIRLPSPAPQEPPPRQGVCDAVPVSVGAAAPLPTLRLAPKASPPQLC